MIKAAAILVVRNEEKRIRPCLESLKWADQIIIVDQSSEDNTVSISREFTNHVFIVPAKGYCEPDRAFAVSKVEAEWIFYIDADERIPEALALEIRQVVESVHYDAYRVLRKNYIFGRLMKYGGHQRDWQLRLFKKGAVTYSDKIHESPSVVGKIGSLSCALDHYSTENLLEYCRKLNAYTDMEAKNMVKAGVRISGYKLVLVPIAKFIQQYFLRQGFRDGREGFVFYVLSAFYVFLKYAKAWERAHLVER